MTDSSVQAIGKGIGAGSVGFGVLALVAPGALRSMYGDRASQGPALDYFGRTWGARTAVLGALVLMASTDEERKRIATLSAAMNVVDSMVAMRAEGLPASTRTMAALTSAGFAAAGAYYAMNL